METQRGGWTLVATKVSPSFLFIKSPFSPVAAKTKNADAASHIHPSMGDWEEVMFRFADVDTIRVIYNRKAGAPNNDKEEFDKYMMGKTVNLIKKCEWILQVQSSRSKQKSRRGFCYHIWLALLFRSWDFRSTRWHRQVDWHVERCWWLKQLHLLRWQQGAGHQVYRGLLLSEQANLGHGPLGNQPSSQCKRSGTQEENVFSKGDIKVE